MLRKIASNGSEIVITVEEAGNGNEYMTDVPGVIVIRVNRD